MVSYGPGSGQIEVDGRSSDHPMLRNTDLGNSVMSVMRGYGGEGGIRTHEGRKPLPVFKTGAFNRSATSP